VPEPGGVDKVMSSTDIWVLPAIAWLAQKLKQAL
jgi:hypothetical protein